MADGTLCAFGPPRLCRDHSWRRVSWDNYGARPCIGKRGIGGLCNAAGSDAWAGMGAFGRAGSAQRSPYCAWQQSVALSSLSLVAQPMRLHFGSPGLPLR